MRAGWLPTLVLVCAPAYAECPPCGPLQCLSDPAFPKLLAAKKEKLKKAGHSASRVDLVDKDGPCQLCLENAPDGFTILIVRRDGSIEVKSWNPEQEKYAKEDVKAGKATSAWIMYARKRCSCCKEKPAEQLPDWDGELSMSKSLALPL